MKPRRPVSMIILDGVLIVWWILFVGMFFAALIMTEAYKPDGLRDFVGKVWLLYLISSFQKGKAGLEVNGRWEDFGPVFCYYFQPSLRFG